jgi:hypothetical protein
MKRITLLTLVFSGLATSAMAQAGLTVGLKGGMNFSNLKVDDPAATYEGRAGYHFGAYTRIKLLKLGIQPELIYSKQGADLTTSTVTDAKQEFNYLNIPVMLKLYLAGGFNLQAGPQFGFLVGGSGEYDPVAAVADGTFDPKEAYDNADIAIGLGAGWEIKSLSIDFRYNIGLSEIDDSASLEATKNQVFQLSLSYALLKLGK